MVSKKNCVAAKDGLAILILYQCSILCWPHPHAVSVSQDVVALQALPACLPATGNGKRRFMLNPFQCACTAVHTQRNITAGTREGFIRNSGCGWQVELSAWASAATEGRQARSRQLRTGWMRSTGSSFWIIQASSDPHHNQQLKVTLGQSQHTTGTSHSVPPDNYSCNPKHW